MADEKLATEEKVPRSVGRRFRRGLLFVVPLDALTGWGSFGVYTLEPGEAAVIHPIPLANPGPSTREPAHPESRSIPLWRLRLA